MEKWVCKECGLYQRANHKKIKAGQRVYFYKNKNHINRFFEHIETNIIRGVVLSKRGNLITVLASGKVSKVLNVDVYPECAPMHFIYNMFGTCEC
ncbi:hypothetical protein F909_00216 [Acinetobacter sp. ANC 3929]|uniref:hypothetical protein n=1 Tax=unclassified Acinetobacter TaxID=196816 RepID=UPI0002CFF2C0|nr:MULTISPECIES: hypothetical protein [unclassified Acinetobacter]ENW84309.1 hypothetical protein F909_00216 [Acinetobacter sp. ANC 3929]ENX42478.1 hypothetical protein F887_00632 [Acinetobacter sp. NIPH 2100]MCH7352421.1 hypothetical protein [Acinetobacter sp. NIPH 2023]MCH7355906.1 hypothetical protein [Acinetobacter sp. NIPH 1958]MCH7359814.1 hypothetical protein [Acinetobacter sp. NIPH 2024]